MNANTKNILTVILFIILVILFLFGLSLIRPSKSTKGKIRVVTTLINKIERHNEEGKYEYFVKDKVKYCYGLYFSSQVYGDKFLSYYEKDDPSTIDIHYDKPVFTKNELTKFSTAKISSTFLYTYLRYMKFSYSTNGKEYTRIQYISDDFEEKYLDLETGQEYQIRYWVENPQRSIIYFDMPIKEDSFRIVE